MLYCAGIKHFIKNRNIKGFGDRVVRAGKFALPREAREVPQSTYDLCPAKPDTDS